MQEQSNIQPINLNRIFRLVLSRWYWIVAALLIFNAVAYLVNRYTVPTHQISTTLMVDKGAEQDPMTFLYSSPGKASGDGGLANEQIILSSFPIIVSTISKLDYRVAYYFGNDLAQHELYKNSPIQVDISSNSTFQPKEIFRLNPRDTTMFELEYEGKQYQGLFGDSLDIQGFIFTVNLTQPDNLMAYDNLYFKANSFNDLVSFFRNKVRVTPLTESVIEVSITHQNIELASDFLNQLSNTAVNNSLSQKRSNSQQIISFIENQIAINYDSLRNFENQIKTFKNNTVAVDPTSEGNRLYATLTQLEEQKANIILSNKYYEYLLKAVAEKEDDFGDLVIPSSVGIQDPILNQLVTQLIELQRDVKLLVAERKLKNPLLVEKKAIIDELKRNIVSNVENQSKASELSIEDIERKMETARIALRQMPGAEQELTTIERDYTLNENLYMLLMQKKMDAGIQSAAVSSEYRTINRAYHAGTITASPFRNYVAAILLSLILPIGLILLVDFFDNRIKSKDEVAALTTLPILGSVPYSKDEQDRQNINSPIMEAFRQLRANLRYIGTDKKVVLMTSSTSGDGKSFCSQNLSYVLSLTQMKVLWIDADLRKPNMDKKAKKAVGLSEYLAGFAELEQIIVPGGEQPGNLDIIWAGSLPPNPAELLISKRMTELINLMRETYDYILIDTPPISIFADAMELMPQVDHSLLLVRMKHTKEPALKLVLDMIRKRDYKDTSMLINGVTFKGTQYGYHHYYNSNGKPKKGRKKQKA